MEFNAIDKMLAKKQHARDLRRQLKRMNQVCVNGVWYDKEKVIQVSEDSWVIKA
jgi:hypothetical protein